MKNGQLWVIRRQQTDWMRAARAKGCLFFLLALIGHLLGGGARTAALAAEGPRVTQSPRLEWQEREVNRWQKIEGTITWDKEYANPFEPSEVTVDVLITCPDGRTVIQPAFWMEDYWWRALGRQRGGEWIYPQGRPQWQVRFTPTQVGVHSAVVRIKDRDGQAESAPVMFTCIDAPGRGFLRVSARDPRFFAFDDGTPFFAIGQNVAFIDSQGQYFTLSGAIEAFGKLAENGANYVRVWTCCEDWALCLEGRKSAWSRSWAWRPPWIDRPDHIPPPDFPRGSPFARLSGDKLIRFGAEPLRPDPCHRVAVLPKTVYRLRVALFAEKTGQVICRLFGRDTVFQIGPDEVNSWQIKQADVTSPDDALWLGPLELTASTTGSKGEIYLGGLSLQDPSTGRELLWETEIARPVLGRYNPVDAFMLDQLVVAAEQKGIYLQLCLLTRDLYMERLGDPASADYAAAIADAKRTFRYAVARWGYSPHVAAWEYWNEMDPGKPTDRFYEELGQYLEEIDPYRHLRTTSAWGPSPKDCRHPRLDIAEVHYYLRPVDRPRLRDEVAAVLDRAAFLREHAPQKPVLISEFGLADDRWREDPEMPGDKDLLHVHNALWASLLSGTSSTTMFWWWDQLDRMNVYPHYRPIARFAAQIPFTKEPLQAAFWRDDAQGVRVLGLVARSGGYFWIIRDRGTWLSRLNKLPPPETAPASVSLPQLAAGRYRLIWWDTWQGQPLKETTAEINAPGGLVTTVEFTGDVAVIAQPVQ